MTLLSIIIINITKDGVLGIVIVFLCQIYNNAIHGFFLCVYSDLQPLPLPLTPPQLSKNFVKCHIDPPRVLHAYFYARGSNIIHFLAYFYVCFLLVYVLFGNKLGQI
ncbi:hypothetical protein Hanom_Chr14g01275221 [Helianthus anomalus]